MGDRALKGLIKADRPWTVVVWCVAHRLELAIKDALKGTLIDEMLMRRCVCTAFMLKPQRSVENLKR